jgi:2-C-methyl-D-erythritol 4-phosphate cytidylyltransferase
VQRWLETGDFEVVTCPKLIDELTDVLTRRPRLRRWIDVETAEAFIDAVRSAAELVSDPIDCVTHDACRRRVSDGPERIRC